jgi:uncharacterized RDD family membrane protein YckC
MSAIDPSTVASVRATRVLAFLVDFVLLTVVTAMLWFVFFVLRAFVGIGSMLGTQSGGSASTAAVVGASLLDLTLGFVMWAVIALVVGGYFVATLQAWGQTLGMRLLDLLVVDDDGSEITQAQAIKRTAVLLVPIPLMALSSVLVPLVGFPIALTMMAGWLLVEAAVLFVDDDAQRLGDRVAGTLVVEEPTV